MSHTLTGNAPDMLLFRRLTIIDYATGGEAVSASEVVGSAIIDGVIFGTVPAGQNSLGVPLFPLLGGGKVMLFRFTAGAPVEIAPTVGLNAAIPCIVKIGG